MRDDDHQYLHKRELAERAAAKNASCDAARRVHQELARNYSERVREAKRPDLER